MLLDRIIRAWKDPEYRHSLSADDQALLPENPAGAIELTDDELEMAAGGHRPSRSFSSSSNSSNSSSSSNHSSSSSSRKPHRRFHNRRRSHHHQKSHRRHW